MSRRREKQRIGPMAQTMVEMRAENTSMTRRERGMRAAYPLLPANRG